MVTKHGKMFGAIFESKLLRDKWELEWIAKRLNSAVPATEQESKRAIKTLINAFHGRVSGKFLKDTIVMGKAANDDLVFYVLYPVSAWTRSKTQHANEYTVGSIEIDRDIPGRTSMVAGATGEIRQSDPVELRK